MKIKKCLQTNQRKRVLNRNKARLVNRRHAQFTADLFNGDSSTSETSEESSTNVSD